MRVIYLSAIFIVTFLVIGCGSITNITSTWKSPEFNQQHFSRIMVIGIIRESDRSIRERMEAHIVGDLTNLGYEAISAYEKFGPKAFEGLTEKETLDQLHVEGIDGVLTVVLLDKKKERYYIPSHMVNTPYVMTQDHFWGYYQSLISRVYMPGYFEESQRYFWESNLYDLASNKLLYSVQTQSFAPTSTEQLAHQYGEKIVRIMVKNKVLKLQKEIGLGNNIKP
jgi:hypothetical protein